MQTTQFPAMLAICTTLIASGSAEAVERCRGTISDQDGAILINASGLNGPIRWGYSESTATSVFVNEDDCVSGSVASGCVLAAPGTEERVVPPPQCSIYVADDLGLCRAYIRRCVARPSCTAPCGTGSCGNGIVEGSEECEWGNAGSSTCESLGLGHGTLGCVVGACTHDTALCGQSKHVFITSIRYYGQMEPATGGSPSVGTAGADGRCQQHATNAGLAGTYRAWVGGRIAFSVASRFSHANIPYVMLDPARTKVADDWSDLTDGSLDASISFNEYGDAVSADRVWTGTQPDGNEADVLERCSSPNDVDWNNAHVGTAGRYGRSDATDAQWTSSGVAPCSNNYRIYCFEQ